MKFFKSSIFLLIISIVFGCYLFLEIKDVNHKIYAVNDEIKEISEVQINSKKAKILISNVNNNWVLNNKDKGDLKTINTMLHNLNDKIEKTVLTNPGANDLKSFGLEKPEMTIKVKGSVNGKEETLYVGSAVPVGFGRYVWIKSKNIIVISPQIYDSLNKTINDLKEKTKRNKS